ncbi:unnamed protein product [Clavelina lepadiformis]|uniref:C2H2-type domain-containing protein n=1 Tax=Clavelina lepadiformis TaxID=159417 RepID=A0ABP0GYX0_CLALP
MLMVNDRLKVMLMVLVSIAKRLLKDFQSCERCEKVSSNKEALKRHLKKNQVDRSTKKCHQCKFCDYSSDFTTRFRYHMFTHTGEKAVICENCKKAFKEKCNLRRHERIYTGEKMYTCDKCTD